MFSESMLVCALNRSCPIDNTFAVSREEGKSSSCIQFGGSEIELRKAYHYHSGKAEHNKTLTYLKTPAIGYEDFPKEEDGRKAALEESLAYPSKPSIATFLRTCGITRSLFHSRRIHAYIIRANLENDIYLVNLILQTYGKCSSLNDAFVVFNKISWRRNVFSWNIMISILAHHEQIEVAYEFFKRMPARNVVSWNSIIAAYSHDGRGLEALQLFQQMRLEGLKADKTTLVTVLSVCAIERDLQVGKQVHIQAVEGGYELDIAVGTALINMYGKCNNVEEASIIFHKLTRRDLVAWTAMITVYAQHGNGKEATSLYKQMLQKGMRPDKVTFTSVLDACAGISDLLEGKQVHLGIMRFGVQLDAAVSNALINMYGKCRSLEDAQDTFDRLSRQSAFSWNVIVGIFDQLGHEKQAILLFQQMIHQGINPDEVTFVSVLSACAKSLALNNGKQIHVKILEKGLEEDISVCNALMNMYGKCGSLEDALVLFGKLPNKNLLSWNIMIATYAQHEDEKHALLLFHQLRQQGIGPDEITFVSVLSAIKSKSMLHEGQEIHQHIVANGLESDVYVGNALINMYRKCGSLEEAWKVFDNMPEQNLVSWTSIVAACTQHGQCKEAVHLFQQMQSQGINPDKVSLLIVLDSCASMSLLTVGEQIHKHILSQEFKSDVVLGNALLNMYGKCGASGDMIQVFDMIKEPDIISWTALIGAYAQHGYHKKALQAFSRMLHQGKLPNDITIMHVLSACSHAGLLEKGCHLLVSASCDYGAFLTEQHFNCALDLIGRAGWLNEQEDLILNVPLHLTVMSWMTLLGSCSIYIDIKRAKHAAEYILNLDPGNATAYILLANICSSTSHLEEG